MPDRCDPPCNLDESALRASAAAIASRIRFDEETLYQIIQLLRARALTSDVSAQHVEAALDRLAIQLTQLLTTILKCSLEDNREYLRSIRRFFLHPKPSYSLRDLAAVWHVPHDEIRNVFHDELALWMETHSDDADELQIEWANALGAADMFGLVRAVDIEQALGADFGLIRPESWRTVPVLLHLPRFIAQAIGSDSRAGSRCSLAARVEQFIFDSFAADRRRDVIPDGAVHSDGN